MAITVTNLGTGSNKTGAQISFTAANAAAAGTIILVAVCDSGTSNTNLPSDTQGNTYANVTSAVFNNSTGTADGFTALYYTIVSTALTTSDSIRYTPTNAAGGAVTAFFLTNVNRVTPWQVASLNTARGSSTAPSATTSVAQVDPGCCIVGILGTHGPSGDTFTQDTTHATFVAPPTRVGTSGGNANTNYTIAGGSVIRTGSTETALIYGPTITSRAWGEIILAFQPQLITGVSGTGGVGTITASYTGSGSPLGVRAVGFPNPPAIDYNFTSNSIPSGLTFSRASAGYYFDSTGTLQSASTDTPRFEYDYLTLAWRGLLLEQSSTNYVRNPRGEGGTAGNVSGGALNGTVPTNWTVDGNGGGLTEYLGTGSVNGIPTTKWRIHGTLTDTNPFGINPERGTNFITGLALNTYLAPSFWIRITAGNTTGIASFNFWGEARDSSNSTAGSSGIYQTAFTPTSTWTRFSLTAGSAWQVFGGSGAPYAISGMGIVIYTTGIGAVVDCTFEVGGYQLEVGDACTSLMLPPVSSPGSSSRSADQLKNTSIGSWYSGTHSTVVAEAMVTYSQTTQLGFPAIWEIDDNSTNNRFFEALNANTALQVLAQDAYTSNIGDVGFAPGNATANVAFGVAFAISNTAASVALDGGTVNTATPAHFPGSLLNTLWIGSLAGGNILNGYIRRFRYWARVLPDYYLQELSGDYVPVPSSANRIRNWQAGGAVAGSGVAGVGASSPPLPTHWQASCANALTISVVGSGTTSGISYVDISVTGTVTDLGTVLALNLAEDIGYYDTPSAPITARAGQTWTHSAFLAITSGSAPSTVQLGFEVIDSSGGNAAWVLGTITPTSTLSLHSFTGVVSGSTTTNILPNLWFFATNGQVVNFTVRVGNPVLVQTVEAAAAPQVGGSPSGVQAQGVAQSWGTNLIDYSFTGGVAPSTLPTNMFGFGALSGLTATYAYGTENGIAYIDIRLSGTSTASPSAEIAWAFAPANPQPVSGTAGPVSVGQTWVVEAYVKQVGGTATNVQDFRMHIDEKDATGTYLIGNVNIYPTPFWTNPLGTVVASYTRTLTNSSVTGLTPYFSISYFGGPIDITFRIGQPMLSRATLGAGTFARASSATYIDSSGRMQLAGSNVLRTDYSTATNLSVTSIGSNTGKTVSSIVITLANAVPSGATIFVAIATAGSSVLVNIADSVGQTTWVGGNGAATANGTIILDWAWNATAMPASSTITITKSGGGTFTGAVYAWYVAGLLTSTSPLDTAQTGSGSGTAVTLTTGTLGQVAEYVVGALAVAGPGTETFTNDSNYNLLPSYRVGTTGGSDITVDVGMRLVIGTTTGVTYAPTLGTSENWAAYLATFKQTGWGRVLLEAASQNTIPNANTGNPGFTAVSSTAIPPLYSAATVWKCTSTGGAGYSFNSAAFVSVPITPLAMWTASAWIYLPTGYSDSVVEVDWDASIGTYPANGVQALLVANRQTNNSLTGQWQRIWVTVMTSADTVMNIVLRLPQTSTAGAFFYTSAWQIEPGNLSSYIPTSGSAASRAIDVASPTGDEILGKIISPVLATGGAGTFAKTIQGTVTSATGYGVAQVQYEDWIRNSTASGASAGTPGTPPTNWTVGVSNNVAFNIIGTGTENGIQYVDIQWTGTSNNAWVSFSPESAGYVLARIGQSWAFATYMKLAAGSFTNVNNVLLLIQEFDSTVSYIQNDLQTFSLPTSAALNTQLFSTTQTTTSPACASIWPGIQFNLTGTSVAVNFTIRVGFPTLYPTSGYIPSLSRAITGAAGTGAAGTAVGLPTTNATASIYGAVGYAAPENWVRNPSGTGLTPGTLGSGGVMPTNWAQTGTNSLNYDISVGATYNVNGIPIPTVRIRIYGTTTDTSACNIIYEYAGGILGLPFGVTKTQSIYVALVSGTPPAAGPLSGFTHWGQILDNTNAVVIDQQNAFTPTSTFTQFSQSNTMPGSGNAPFKWQYAGVLIYTGVSAGNTYDWTFDLGGGQLATQTSPITPSIGSVTGGITGVSASGSVASLSGGSFSRASPATYVDTAGIVRTVGNDVLRYQSSRALIEPAATNIALNSQSLTSWPSFNVTKTDNVTTAPDGTTTGASVVPNTNSAQHLTSPAALTVTANTKFTASIYAKPFGYPRVMLFLAESGLTSGVQCTFNVSTGVIDAGPSIVGTGSGQAATITALTNGWYRCTVTGIIDASSTSMRALSYVDNGTTNSFAGDGVSGIYLWGAQVELGSTATSYIATTSGTVTRAADTISTSGIEAIAAVPSGVSSTGSATALASNVLVTLAAISGTGAAASLADSISRALSGVSATGSVQSLAGIEAIAPNAIGVSGTSQVGTFTPSLIATETTALTGLALQSATQNLNALLSPNGTLTATQLIETTSNDDHALNYNFTPVGSTAYTASCYLKQGTRRYAAVEFRVAGAWTNGIAFAVADLQAGTLVNTGGGSAYSITPAGNGWYLVSVTTTSIASPPAAVVRLGLSPDGSALGYTGDGASYAYFWLPALQTNIGVFGAGSATSLGGGTFSRASSATFIDPIGVVETVGTNVLRYQSGVPLIEPSVTNYLIRTTQLQTSWGANAVTVTGNAAIAPDGTLTATLLTETATFNEHFISQTPAIIVNVPYTFSFFAKDITRRYCMLQFYDNTSPANTAQTTYDLQTGTITFNAPNGNAIILGAGMQAIGNAWYRCWVSALLNSVANTNVLCRLRMMVSGSNNVVYTGSTSNQIYFWGAQLEQGSSAPTSFIYTTTVAVTRAADTVSATGIPVVMGTATTVTGVSAVGTVGSEVDCLDPILNLYHNTANTDRLLADPLAGTTIAASFTAPHDLILLEVDLLITK